MVTLGCCFQGVNSKTLTKMSQDGHFLNFNYNFWRLCAIFDKIPEGPSYDRRDDWIVIDNHRRQIAHGL